MATAFLAIWCAAGLGGWWWLLRRADRGQRWRAPAEGWQMGDLIVGGLFALLIALPLMADRTAERALTLRDLQGGALVYGALTALIIGLAYGRGSTPVRLFGLRPARPGTVLLVGLIGIFLTYPLVQAMQEIAALFGRTPGDGDGLVQFLLGKTSVEERVWAVGLAVVIAPITEELIFRGYLYGVFKRFGGRWAAMAASALMFAAMHNNIPAIPALFVLAIGFTLAYELTGSLWAPLVMHILFNLVPVVVILFFPEWIPQP